MKLVKAIKRGFVLALVMALLTGALPIFAYAASGSYYCTGDRVNLRVGPSSSYGSIAKLRKGDVVTFITHANNWYKVKYYRKSTNTVVEGWVYKKYLKAVTGSSKSSGSKSTSALTGSTYKTTANLRVRSEASIDTGYVKTKLRKGTKVTVIKQHKSWVYVTYKGGSGWVSAKYLKKA